MQKLSFDKMQQGISGDKSALIFIAQIGIQIMDSSFLIRQEIGCDVVDSIFVAQDKYQWRDPANTVTNLGVP
jgi:hypothetical protein